MQAGIRGDPPKLGQSACLCGHAPTPHEMLRTEVHRSGGPFTLVPLPDADGLPCSAVVWMDERRGIARRRELDRRRLLPRATERAAAGACPLTLASQRATGRSWERAVSGAACRGNALP